MAQSKTNIAASVHQRLLNKARETSRPFNEVLQLYACERFIFRLSRSPFAERFILKGALIFSTWSGPASRPTMDIDLLGKLNNDLEVITETMKSICVIAAEDDGLIFHAETVTAARIVEIANYEGVRVHIQGNLGNARVSIQIDIGFGDVVIPGPRRVKYPTILDFPAPEINGYTMESTIAEKCHAMMRLGVLNSRMKDFYDIWVLSRAYDFKGKLLAEAVMKTFGSRNTPITAGAVVFSDSFAKEAAKNAQWQGFLTKAKIAGAPVTFEQVATAVRIFLEPLIIALANEQTFRKIWKAPGPWV
ncbi:MAG: nucleotidyl transferase AbiEii/AbiGii toxin family protein [Thermoleophilia bacterium]